MILVIDEVDQFSNYERSFTMMVRWILNSTYKCNISIIGIANSVDLPFRKKHSAIAMRDCQLLFEPYSDDNLITVIEKKLYSAFKKLPSHLKSDETILKLFADIIEPRAYVVVAKKVAKLNGDIRVAFDMIKGAFSALSLQLS